eukprot:scaffold1499_cov170-Amphora_coffeaeformis.AAC.2
MALLWKSYEGKFKEASSFGHHAVSGVGRVVGRPFVRLRHGDIDDARNVPPTEKKARLASRLTPPYCQTLQYTILVYGTAHKR